MLWRRRCCRRRRRWGRCWSWNLLSALWTTLAHIRHSERHGCLRAEILSSDYLDNKCTRGPCHNRVLRLLSSSKTRLTDRLFEGCE